MKVQTVEVIPSHCISLATEHILLCSSCQSGPFRSDSDCNQTEQHLIWHSRDSQHLLSEVIVKDKLYW